MRDDTELQKALTRGMRPGGDLSYELFELGEYGIEEIDDAFAVCQALEDYIVSLDVGEPKNSPLHALASLFQDVVSEPAYGLFSDRGIPLLIRVPIASFPSRRRNQRPAVLAQDLCDLQIGRRGNADQPGGVPSVGPGLVHLGDHF